MKRICTPEDFEFLATQYQVIPKVLTGLAKEMRDANVTEVSVEANQIFNTYAVAAPAAVQTVAASVRGKIETHKQAEMRRARDVAASVVASSQHDQPTPTKKTRKKG